MEIFDTNSFRNTEYVNNEFRNHVISANKNVNHLLHDISNTIIDLVAIDKAFSLKELRKTLQAKFTLDDENEDYFYSNTHDLYNQYQMICRNESRKKLGLRFAIYQGGLRDDSRQFCIERNGKCYSESEIQQWEKLDFQGKSKNYNPLYDSGGINCVHRLDWISDELAKRLRPDLF